MGKPEKCGYCTNQKIKKIKTETGKLRWACMKCGWYKDIKEDF